MPIQLYHGDQIRGLGRVTHPYCEACPREKSHQNIERVGDCVKIKLGQMDMPLCWKHLDQLYAELRDYLTEHPSNGRHREL